VPRFGRGIQLKLRLVLITLLSALVLTAEAPASLSLQTVTRNGNNTSSRLARWDCGFRSNYSGLNDLLLVCDGPDGFAKARYDFYLPRSLYGTPTMHVYADKLCCSSSVVKKTLTHVEGQHYRIVVKVAKRARFDIRSVSLSYYVKT
jgi:hypothetical protein